MVRWAIAFLAGAAFFGLSVEGVDAIGSDGFELSHAVAGGTAFAVVLEVSLLTNRIPSFAKRFAIQAPVFLIALTLASLVIRDEALSWVQAAVVLLIAAFSAAGGSRRLEERLKRWGETYESRHPAG
jgi:hypothetical protein